MTIDVVQKIEKLLDGRDAIGFDVKFDLADDGCVFVSGTKAPIQVSNVDGDADTVFKVSATDLNAMLDGDIAPMMAYMQGKLKVDGDIGQAMKLSSLFS